jgi:hypothetical protein
MAINEQKNSEANANPARDQTPRPNESGTIQVEAHMRIFDPKTNQTIVEGRA